MVHLTCSEVSRSGTSGSEAVLEERNAPRFHRLLLRNSPAPRHHLCYLLTTLQQYPVFSERMKRQEHEVAGRSSCKTSIAVGRCKYIDSIRPMDADDIYIYKSASIMSSSQVETFLFI